MKIRTNHRFRNVSDKLSSCIESGVNVTRVYRGYNDKLLHRHNASIRSGFSSRVDFFSHCYKSLGCNQNSLTDVFTLQFENLPSCY